MLLDHINELYEYNYWATRLILDAAEKLTAEQFNTPSAYPHGSVRDTLTHAIFAEWLWRKRMMGQSPQAGEKMIDPEDFASVDDLRVAWFKEEQSMFAYLGTLKEEQLAHPVSYKTTKGEPFETPLGGLLTHIVLHGMQHRAEVGQMLTEFGHSPGNIDMLIWLREEA